MTVALPQVEKPSKAATPRIALFADTFHEVNGVAKTMQRLVRELSARGVSIDAYVYGPQMEEAGSVVSYPGRAAVRYYEDLIFEAVPNVRFKKEFLQRHRRDPYDLVHIVAPGSLGWLGRRLAQEEGLPLLGTYHTTFSDYLAQRLPKVLYGPAERFAWRTLRRFYRPCGRVLCPTTVVQDQLRERGFTNLLGVFSRGVDTETFSPRRRERSSDGPLRALYVGRIAVEKNVAALPAMFENWPGEIEVVGDGPARADLQRRLPQATFRGYLSGNELAQAYADADVLVFPSLTDTFGNVVLEAMATGTVPLVMDAPGPAAFVTSGENAVVCRDAVAMKQELAALAQNRTRLRTLAEEARRYAEAQSWDSVFERLIDDYRSVVR
jgi:glycosyltransferase involved in cell wall biosynthesis